MHYNDASSQGVRVVDGEEPPVWKGKRMADVIDYEIEGDDMQMVQIELDSGETVRAEAGAMMFMEEGVEMQTSTGGGLLKGFKRTLAGESFFITSFTNNSSAKRHIGFAAPYPGKIIPLDLGSHGGTFMCQKDAFLCAAHGIEIEIGFTRKLGTGLFGGEGFILQRLQGDGLAFIHAGGTIVERTLDPGERLRVDTGCLVAFHPSVTFDIQFIGGFQNALFGGEGVFLATLNGPGLVYLQTLPFARLADRMMAGAKSQRGEEKGVAGIGGSLLGGLLGGDRKF